MAYYTYNHTYWDSIYNHLYKKSSHLILSTHTDIHRDSIFSMNYIHFHSIHIYTQMINTELKILFHLPLILNYILSESCF